MLGDTRMTQNGHLTVVTVHSWFQGSGSCCNTVHLWITCTSPPSLITLIISLLARFHLFMRHFFSLLVWQGVSITSGRNAGEPRIATRGLVLVLSCNSFLISIYLYWWRWKLSMKVDVQQTTLMKALSKTIPVCCVCAKAFITCVWVILSNSKHNSTDGLSGLSN